MAVVRYHRYVGELWTTWTWRSSSTSSPTSSCRAASAGRWRTGRDDLQALHDAILEALLRRGLLSPEELEKLMADQETLDQFLQKTVERLLREGYLRASEASPSTTRPAGARARPARR